MSKTSRTLVFTTACALALLALAAVGVDAQSFKPIDIDDWVACVHVDQQTVLAPLSLRSELEAHYGTSSDVSTMGMLLDSMLPAGPGDLVHIEGGLVSVEVDSRLNQLGYTVVDQVPPELPSAEVAFLRHM
jgi:hypothetical protein